MLVFFSVNIPKNPPKSVVDLCVRRLNRDFAPKIFATMASSSASNSGLGREPKRAKMEAGNFSPKPQFPAEIWEHIFRYIPGSQLLQLRLISHHWSNVIASSPSLMGQFYVRFKQPRGVLTMDAGYVPSNLPPMAIKALFQKCALADSGAVKSWWSAFAKKLTELQIGEGQISAENLFWMLEQAPNLKKLILFRVRLPGSGSGNTNVRLDRLEMLAAYHLRYGDKNHPDILVGLEHKFPSLKELRIDVAVNKKEAELLQSVRTLQSSLQRLHLPTGTNILAELINMKQLRLKELQFDARFPQDSDLWIQFCKAQPRLEELTMSAKTAEILLETGRVLPNLKRLLLTLHGEMEVSFLDAMPGLEYIHIEGDYSKISFLAHTSPNLAQFHLTDVETEDLFQFLQRSPKLAGIYLSDCRLGYREVALTRHFRCLKVLSLEDIICHADLIVSLFGRSPLLEELHLSWLKYLGDEHVLVACKRLRRLRRLSLLSIRCVTDESAKYIQRYCPVLEELEADFSDEVLAELEVDKKIRIKRCNSEWSGEDSGEDDSEEEDDYDEEEVVDADDEEVDVDGKAVDVDNEKVDADDDN